jgi:hypothetical protein
MFPYDGIADYQNWRRAVARVDSHRIDPHAAAKFTLDRSTRIASAGSCFAGRIAESLQSYGFNYHVVEPGPRWLDREQRAAFGYGEYSARYGNVYTTLQLLQLAQRSLGTFEPLERVWQGPDGVLDPFRPSIQPDGFVSADELEADRAQHLAAVRTLLGETDVFVFTLGLTETWADRRDGAVFPACPGRGHGAFDPDRYEFRNLGVAENVDALDRFVQLLWERNPSARVLLTVSPVPLVATMEPRHVLTSTVYSKSVLRVVADEIARRYAQVDYFPSYEIVTATGNDAEYFAADRRNVTPAAVDHVMWSFYRNYCGEELDAMTPASRDDTAFTFEGKPCDDELLLAHLEADHSLRSGQRG